MEKGDKRDKIDKSVRETEGSPYKEMFIPLVSLERKITGCAVTRATAGQGGYMERCIMTTDEILNLTGKSEQWRERARIRDIAGRKHLSIFKENGSTYDIPLYRMQTAEQVLDWIHQVCVAKTWGQEMAADILCAIFYDVIPVAMWSGKA
ncbi:MAG TPA: hypothetical protein PK874_12365 [Desulfobacteraceae bacterium]|nr:hypothetical protein [Desulfobacteraceae bacterium]HPQ28623.1 hypothetical protein [Desulfobacteraceae bacterium]